MSTLQGSSTGGPRYNAYHPQHRDFVRNSYSYDPNKSDFRPTQHQYDYKSYKPVNVGIYGEKSRPNKPRDPPPKPVSRPRKHIPRTTFASYGGPRGPDIPTGNIGPEYRYPEYKYTHVKPSTYEPTKYDGDFVAGKTYHYDKNSFKPVAGTEKYELTEQNYGGFRHFHFGAINDPISAKGTQGITQEKYLPAEQPRKATPKEPKKPEAKAAPVVAAVIAVPVAKTGPKQFVTAGTQYQQQEYKTQDTQTTVNPVKTTAVQYESTQTRVFGTQVEQPAVTSTGIQTNTPSPAPQVVPLVMAGNIQSKVKTNTQGVQCSTSTVKTEARGTQYDQPPLTSRQPTPRHEEVRRESPVYRAQRTPSPEVVQIKAVASTQSNKSNVKQEPVIPVTSTKAPSPRQQQTPPKALTRDSRWTPSPEAPLILPVAREDASAAKAKSPVQAKPGLPKDKPPSPETPAYLPKMSPARNSPAKAVTAEQHPVVQSKPPKQFIPRTEPVADVPVKPNRSRLPPEITALIEAYDSVHMDGTTGSLPSMQRSMALT